MTEFITNLSNSGLFGLIAVVLIIIVLLMTAIIVLFFRRQKKSKMKLGLHSVSRAANEMITPSNEPATARQPDTPPVAANKVADAPEPAIDLDLGILASLTNQNSPAEKAAPPEEVKPEPAQPVKPATLAGGASTSANPVSAPAPPASPEPAELLRLLRDPQSGQLIVEIGGQRYAKLADITDKKIGQYVLKLTAHLLAFTNGVIVTEAGMKSVYKPKLAGVPQPIATSAGAPSPQPPAQSTDQPQSLPSQSKVDPLPPLPGLTLQSPVSSQPGGLLGRVAQPPPPPSNLPGLNLAEEINDIVQARLRYSPLAEDNTVEITSDLSGGIRIQVNGRYYTSPDEVPDPDIKRLIQASIKEWERS